MEKVTAENLKIGDVLAKDILSNKGITILKKGTVLTDKFIANIKKLNSDFGGASENFIFIEGNSNAQTEKISTDKEKELSELDKRFQYVESYEFMREIKEIIKNAIIKN